MNTAKKLKAFDETKKTVVHIITSLKMGGAESLLVEFIDRPEVAEFNHYVLYFYDGPNRIQLQKKGVHCFAIEGLVGLYDPFFFIRVYRLMKKLQPACIHSWLWSANLVGRVIGYWLKIPVLTSFHSEVTNDGKIRNCLDYYTHHLSQKIVAVSYGVAQSLMVTNKPTIGGKITIIKNGIDAVMTRTKSAECSVPRKKLGLSDEHYIIGSVGRWTSCKNYSFLLDLFSLVYKKNCNSRLLLIGKGELKEALMEQARALGLSDEIIFIEGQKALGYYSSMDCFIQTTFKEGISLALLEAMSCSIPCIVIQNSPEHDVIINEHNGILISQHSLELGVSAIEATLSNKKYAQTLAQEGYATVRDRFSIKNMAALYAQEYNQLINFDHYLL